MKPIATLEDVTVQYGERQVLKGVNVDCKPGRVLSLVGPNGSGKTTAIKVLTGLLEPVSGRATVNGHRPSSRSGRRSIAFVPDAFVGLDELTIKEYLQLHARLHKNSQAFIRSLSLLQAFGLNGRESSALSSLSMGMRRQVSICAAAGLKAELFVIDEATATLDPEAVVVLRSIVGELAELGTAVLIATQDLNFAEAVSDDVVMISNGVPVSQGPLAELLADGSFTSLEELFLSRVEHAIDVEEVRRALSC